MSKIAAVLLQELSLVEPLPSMQVDQVGGALPVSVLVDGGYGLARAPAVAELNTHYVVPPGPLSPGPAVQPLERDLGVGLPVTAWTTGDLSGGRSTFGHWAGWERGDW